MKCKSILTSTQRKTTDFSHAAYLCKPFPSTARMLQPKQAGGAAPGWDWRAVQTRLSRTSRQRQRPHRALFHQADLLGLRFIYEQPPHLHYEDFGFFIENLNTNRRLTAEGAITNLEQPSTDSPWRHHQEYPEECCAPSPGAKHAHQCHEAQHQHTRAQTGSQTLEQTKSTSVASSSPMYSMIFLLIHGRMRRSIKV